MKRLRSFIRWMAVLGLVPTSFLLACLLLFSQTLPDDTDILKAELKLPLTVYTEDGAVIARISAEKRIKVSWEDLPPLLVKAVIAAEDSAFFTHGGLSWPDMVRAALSLVTTGKKSQGASTITMQVARNYFLSQEKTFSRKIKEILLAYRIERLFSKETILTMYANKIFLGHRSYGFEQAARTYYNQPLSELSLAQIAMLAGLPKAPSAYNPIANPERSLIRRNYVLKRMLDSGTIDQEAFDASTEAPLTAKINLDRYQVYAPHVSEMVREYMVKHFGKTSLEKGYKVYTTLKSSYQTQAIEALRQGLIDYAKRQQSFKPLGKLDPKEDVEAIADALSSYPKVADFRVAWVKRVTKDTTQISTEDGAVFDLDNKSLAWIKRSYYLRKGDIVYYRMASDTPHIVPKPEIEGSIVSLHPKTGALLALMGGFDFYHGYKFNHATQAQRQPGSAFKPFIYALALDHGYLPSTLVNDAPIVLKDPNLEDVWKPKNYSEKFLGPIRLRVALARSINLISIKLLRDIGIKPAITFLEKFGFGPDKLRRNKNLSLSLGSMSVTPIELTEAYTPFVNEGLLSTFQFIQKIVNEKDEVIYENPALSCVQTLPVDSEEALSPPTDGFCDKPRVLSKANAFLMHSMLQSTVQFGTARRLKQLNRSDLAGKTGTTNNNHDSWFVGFNDNIITTVWAGYSNELQSLGRWATGAGLAVPIWLQFSRNIIDDIPLTEPLTPPTLLQRSIDPKTGKLVPEGEGVLEFFPVDTLLKEGNEPTNDGLLEDIFNE